MHNIFNYENKVMQLLMILGDLIIMNVLFLICCIPVFTIGAAQAGLYTGIRVLLDKEDDSSCAKAFFAGFKNGFGTITLAYLPMELLLAALVVCVYIMGQIASQLWMMIIAFAAVSICLVVMAMMTWFHARFGCKARQLPRNGFYLLLAHPIRSVLVAALTNLPLFLLVIDPASFMAMTPLTLTLFFSTMYLFSFSIMKKPFLGLVELNKEKSGQEKSDDAPSLPPEE